MNAGLVSTVIPVFNRPRLLREAVQSVLDQDWRPIEIIIVDDGSTDETPQVIAELERLNPAVIRSARQANGGPGVGRETGRQMARGEYIQYLDSDDLLLPGKFTVQVDALQDDPEAGICYGVVLDTDPKTGTRFITHDTDVERRTIFPAVARRRLWHTASPLYRRCASDAIGPWGSQRILEDWEYEARAGLRGVLLCHVSQPVAIGRDGGDTHAGYAWMDNLDAMRDRLMVHATILRYARRAGVAPAAPEMQELVRSLFWMSREAAARGLVPEARELFDLARTHATISQWQYPLFRAAVAVLGWRGAARLAGLLHAGPQEAA